MAAWRSMLGGMAELPPPALPPGVPVVDLRPAELRFREPLEKLIPNPVTPLSLEAIEEGRHGLTGEVVVICERGIRSPLAARFLRADGVEARHYEGGVPALKRALSEAGGR